MNDSAPARGCVTRPDRATYRVPCFLAGLLLSACGPAADSLDSAVRLDSAGVSIITHSEVDVRLGWTFERVSELRLTEGDDPGFGRVFASGIGADAAGTTYVLDVLNHHVSLFDSTGLHVGNVGRAGSGPGELRFPSDLAVDAAGMIAIHDFDRRAVVLLAPDGGWLADIQVPGPLLRQLSLGRGGVTGVYRVSEGDASASRLRLIETDLRTSAERIIVDIADAQTVDLDLGCIRSPMRRPLFHSIVWDAAGGRLALAASNGYVVDIHDGGRLTGSWRRSLTPLEATAELAATDLANTGILRMAEAGGCATNPVEAARRVGFAAAAPHIIQLAVSPAGRVWVERRTTVPGVSITDVWNPDGEYLGTLPAGSLFPAAFRSADEIVVVETDSVGLAHVRIYRIGRPTG